LASERANFEPNPNEVKDILLQLTTENRTLIERLETLKKAKQSSKRAKIHWMKMYESQGKKQRKDCKAMELKISKLQEEKIDAVQKYTDALSNFLTSNQIDICLIKRSPNGMRKTLAKH
jgi:hypothetical protein